MSAPTGRTRAVSRIVCAALLLSTACSDQNQRPRLTEPLFGKTPAAPTVTTASPSYTYQGTVNLNVTINGSGFDRGTKASWYLHGLPYPKITVNSTSYVSASQLVANISVASDASIDSYDIVVTTSTTKQGIGSDCFAVTLAVPIPVVGRGINMAGQVVGDPTSKNSSGVLWDPRAGLAQLPNASRAFAIDESGTTVSGKDNNGAAAIWTTGSGPSGPWTETILPLPQGNTIGAARSIAVDVNGNAVIMVGVSQPIDRPVVWTRTSNGWTVSIVDTVPAGVPRGVAFSVNAKGQHVGSDGVPGAYALYWDSSGTAAILSSNAAAAWSINGDGTLVVGDANGVAAMWTRTLSNGMYGPWSGAISLDTPANSCSTPASIAYAVNAAGTVAVGTSCGVPVAWNISGTTVTRFLLGTLGPPNTGTAYAINNLATPIAAGGVNPASSGFGSGVLWKSF